MKRLFKNLFLILFLLSAIGCAQAPHEFGGVVYDPPTPIADFTLTAANSQPVSLSDYQGKYLFIYFGYTFCPDVCPTTLSKLAAVQQALGDDAEKMQVVMVSVDPERDTPELLAEYVHHFNDGFVGITGSLEQIDAAGNPFGLYYARHEGTAESGYLVDHTARVFLLNPEGHVIVAYAHDAAEDVVLADLQYLLANDG
ncbi:MAG: SCO family protein [Candidatus Promineifilaceae bacterium]